MRVPAALLSKLGTFYVYAINHLQPNPAVNRTACKLRLQVPSAFGSGGRLPLR